MLIWKHKGTHLHVTSEYFFLNNASKKYTPHRTLYASKDDLSLCTNKLLACQGHRPGSLPQFRSVSDI